MIGISVQLGNNSSLTLWDLRLFLNDTLLLALELALMQTVTNRLIGLRLVFDLAKYMHVC